MKLLDRERKKKKEVKKEGEKIEAVECEDKVEDASDLVVMHASLVFVWDTNSVLELVQVENVVGGVSSWRLAPLPCNIVVCEQQWYTEQNLCCWMVARSQLLGLEQDIGVRWLCGRSMMGGSGVDSFPDPALEVSAWHHLCVCVCVCVCPAGIGLLKCWMCDDLWYFTFVWIWRWWWSRPIRQQWATFWMDVLQKLQAVRMSVLQTRMMMPFTPDSHVLTTWNFFWKVCLEHMCVILSEIGKLLDNSS